MWIDADAIFMNFNTTIESYIPEYGKSIYTQDDEISLIFSGHSNAISSGVLLFRNSERSFHILSEAWNIGIIMEGKRQIGMG